MATTKIHEIRSTLGKAIRYICNPEKTDNMTLIFSNAIPTSFDVKAFSDTAEKIMTATAKNGTSRAKKGNRLAYHLIQSFSPEDNITPIIANEIGKKYAARITEEKNEYVVTTHTDRDHIHNHIIFNATSFETKKKYHHSARDIKRIQDISDRLCREYMVSVINEKTGRKGLQHDEYEKAKKGTSWRVRLANLIDEAVYNSSNFDEFLFQLTQEGVSVKQGKDLSYKCELLGQERACRGKSIGIGYTKESIIARINNDTGYLSAHGIKRYGALDLDLNKDILAKPVNTINKSKDSALDNSFKNEKIRLIKNIHDIEKAKTSKAYANKVDAGNIKNLLKSVNYLEEHNFDTSEDLANHEIMLSNKYKLIELDIERLEEKKKLLTQKISMIQNYIKSKECYYDYLKSKNKHEYKLAHNNELESFAIADIYLKHNDINISTQNLNLLFAELKDLNQELRKYKNTASSIKKELSEAQVVRKNYEAILERKLIDISEETDISHNRTSIHNAQPLDFIHEHKAKLELSYATIKDEYDKVETERKEKSIQIEMLQKYLKNQSTYTAYIKTDKDDKFYLQNADSISNFNEASNYFKEKDIDPSNLELKALFDELKTIVYSRNKQKESVKIMKHELDIHKLYDDIIHLKKDKSIQKTPDKKVRTHKKSDIHSER